MSWFRVDDTAPSHPKMRRAGRDGRLLWYAAGPLSSQQGREGFVEALVLQDAAHYAEVDDYEAAAKRLVAVGLWHDAKALARCDSEFCSTVVAGGRRLAKGEYQFHDFFQWNFTNDVSKLPTERRKENRRKALSRDRHRCNEILDRDGTLCRYCGRRVDARDKRGPRGLTYDHVDPDKFEPEGGNALADVVVACRECNGVKGDRTPEEAGMPLLPPRTSALTLVSGPDLTGAENGSDRGQEISGPGPKITGPDLAGTWPVSDPVLASRAHPRATPDTGQVGPSSGQSRAKSGPSRSGPASDAATGVAGDGGGPVPGTGEGPAR